MITLGIDPGSRHTGYGLVRADGSTLTPLAYGRFSCRPREPLPERLAFLHSELTALVQEWEPAIVAVESTFHGINPKSLIVLSQARGSLLAALGAAGLPVREFAPSEVKIAVTGQGRADKVQVARMVRLVLALREEKIPEDATDALALAICCCHRSKLDRLSGR